MDLAKSNQIHILFCFLHLSKFFEQLQWLRSPVKSNASNFQNLILISYICHYNICKENYRCISSKMIIK